MGRLAGRRLLASAEDRSSGRQGVGVRALTWQVGGSASRASAVGVGRRQISSAKTSASGRRLAGRRHWRRQKVGRRKTDLVGEDESPGRQEDRSRQGGREAERSRRNTSQTPHDGKETDRRRQGGRATSKNFAGRPRRKTSQGDREIDRQQAGRQRRARRRKGRRHRQTLDLSSRPL